VDDKEASETKEEKQGRVAKAFAEALPILLDKAMDLYTRYKAEERADEAKALNMMTSHNRRIIGILVAFASVVITAMTVLVIFDKVSGDALLFAVGSAIGYVFALVQRFVFYSNNGNSEQSG
jgi:hypothetical protein